MFGMFRHTGCGLGLGPNPGTRRGARSVVGACALALLLPAFTGSAASADPVPKQALGIWSAGDCNSEGEMYFVSAGPALVFSGSRVAVASASWAGGALIVKLAKKRTVLPLDDLIRCRALPPLFQAFFPETVALLRAFGRVRPHCENTKSAACVAAVFQELDVADDGRLSSAEMGRFLRAAGFFVGYALTVANRTQRTNRAAQGNAPLPKAALFVPLEELVAVPALTALVGSFVTDSLIRSYDYDGDGFLSIKELMQDHVSQEMTAIAGALGTAGTDAAATAVLGFLPGLLRALRLGG